MCPNVIISVVRFLEKRESFDTDRNEKKQLQ
jgi:hypothetical protein